MPGPICSLNGCGAWACSESHETRGTSLAVGPADLGPELGAQEVRVWLNGKEERIVQFNKIPEHDGEF